MSAGYYRRLLDQRRRIEGFRSAINAVVGPGDRVLDIGAGLGTFAFFAAGAGAHTVWGVDGDPIVHVAQTIGRLNGYAERVRFVRGWLPEVDLGDRATVVIFEDFAPRVMTADLVRLMRAVKARHCEPDARWIPARGHVYLAPVASAAAWHAAMGLLDGERCYGIDWSASRAYAANSPLPVPMTAEVLAAPAMHVATVAFGGDVAVTELGGRARWSTVAAPVIHGLAYWVDLELAEGIRLSNAPGAAPGSWGHVLLPFDPPLTVSPGCELEVEVGCDALAGGLPGWLYWRGCAGDQEARGHEFASEPASIGDLLGTAPDAVPRLNDRGVLEARILALADGRRSLREMARAVAAGAGIAADAALHLVIRALDGRIEMAGLGTLDLERERTHDGYGPS